jgi:hypothetical protein
MINCSNIFANSEEDVKSFSIPLDAIVKDQYVGKERNLDFYIIREPDWCRKFTVRVTNYVLIKNSGKFKSEIHIHKYIDDLN